MSDGEKAICRDAPGSASAKGRDGCPRRVPGGGGWLSRSGGPALFAVTSVFGAALLFSVQPILAKAAAPVLGGVPAVWTTAMAFFQACLLAGYGYAHWLSRRLSAQAQLAVHVVLLIAALGFLPLGLEISAEATGPVAALLAALIRTAALPVIVMSAGAPLLQSWFASSRHRGAGNPYFLYAASNAGSFAGLLAYPSLIEPFWNLEQQRVGWAAGFAALALLTAACGSLRLRAPASPPIPPPPIGPAPTTIERWRWFALAAVPTALMVGATTHATMTVAAVPLLWVLPLALYLLSYVIAFGPSLPRLQAGAEKVAPFGLIAAAPLLAADARIMQSMVVVLSLALFFVLALLGHLRLAAARPPAGRLTEFYGWVALGGTAGGMGSALLAPLVFPGPWEYPAAMVLASSFLPTRRSDSPRQRQLDWLAPALLAALIAACVALAFTLLPDPTSLVARALVIAAPSIVCFGFKDRPRRFLLGLAALQLGLGVYVTMAQGAIVASDRNFFGVKQVVREPDGKSLSLRHNGVRHGSQFLAPSERGIPTTYYAESGPLGDVFGLLQARLPEMRVGAIGLGVGTIAAYARPSDRFTFLEIDPGVVSLGGDPAHFTFVDACGDRCRIVIADGRTGLRSMAPKQLDLLVVDAFTGGAIPVHLLSLEALQEYFSRLTDRGLIALHISNRHIDLEPVVAAAAAAGGWTALVRHDPSESPAVSPSVWVALADEPQVLSGFAGLPGWVPLRRQDGLRPWTDSYSSLTQVLRW